MIPIERVVYVDDQPWLLTRLGDNDADLESFRQKWIRIPVERLTFTDFPCDPDQARVVGLKRDGGGFIIPHGPDETDYQSVQCDQPAVALEKYGPHKKQTLAVCEKHRHIVKGWYRQIAHGGLVDCEMPTRKWGLVRVLDDSPNLVHIEAEFAPYDFWVRLDDFESETQAVERAQKYCMAA